MRLCAIVLASAVLSQTTCFPPGWPRKEQPLYLNDQPPFDVGPYLVLLAPGRVAVVLEHDLDTPPIVH